MLRDIMGDLGLSTYPEVALVLFFTAFLVILGYVLFRKKGAWDRASQLPLEDTEIGEGSPDGREDRSHG